MKKLIGLILMLLAVQTGFAQRSAFTVAQHDSATRAVLRGSVPLADSAAVSGSAATTIKVYRALIAQSGTDEPTVIELENTLGDSVVWARSDVGLYTGTLAGAFTLNKTHCLSNGDYNDGAVSQAVLNPDNGENFVLLTTFSPTGTQSDIGGGVCHVQILVYP